MNEGMNEKERGNMAKRGQKKGKEGERKDATLDNFRRFSLNSIPGKY